ncbi:MAG: cell division protein FtsA [Candidatus Zixiibacteriota bacterium]|nr:MAG: cell division protein FtsA [candidate division Zixibacteria bacterium]
MARENIIAVVDLGTSKIVVLVAEMDAEGKVYVIGHGSHPAEGLRRGVIVDMDKSVTSIRKAVNDAALVSGTEIDRVTVGINGEHIRSVNSHGVVAVSRVDNEVTRADVDKALEAARSAAIPVDREIIHVIPQEFSVDDQSGIKDPIGMSGVRLEVEAHLVTASIASARNIYRAFERCRLEVDHIVLESLAIAEVLLSSEQIDYGAVVVDIGAELTGISVFFDGAIRHTAVIPLGSKNVTNDIAIGLRATVDQAEALKISYGAALASVVDPEDMATVESAGGRGPREISRHVLASIIEPRMEEILSLVVHEVKRASASEILTGGLILSGGGALLAGTPELAEQMMDMPTSRGIIENFEHIPEGLNTIAYATAHGLILYGFKHEPMKSGVSGRMRRMLQRFEQWITKKF